MKRPISVEALTKGACKARDGAIVRLRNATIDDAERTFLWQNDDRTRRYSHNPNKPQWNEHLKWINNYLASSGHLFIIEHDNEPAGSLRLDPQPTEGFMISLYTDPKKYRVGVAVPALNIVRALMPDVDFHAEVIDGNIAAIRMLAEAGYIETHHGHYVNHPAYNEHISKESFINILKAVAHHADESWLDMEVQDTPLDSLDLLELRASLEVYLKHGITDRLWFKAMTLKELLNGLNSKIKT